MPLTASSSSPDLIPKSIVIETVSGDIKGKRRDSIEPCHRRASLLDIPDQRDDAYETRERPSSIGLVDSIRRKDWTAAALRVRQHPDEATAWETVSVRGRPTSLLPLHYACTLRSPPFLIRALLDAAPETAEAKDPKGRLPLHWACDAAGSSPEVVDILLDAYGAGAGERESKYGFLPLHIACFYESSQGNSVDGVENRNDPKDRAHIVLRLIEEFPKGIWYRDNKQWLPLHIAARTGTSEVVKLLVEFPTGASKEDEDGRLPIHLACLNKGKEDDVLAIVDTLATTYPEGLRKKEARFGFLPLHIACSTASPSVRVVEALLRHYPHAAREEDDFLSSPLHVAARANAPPGIVAALVRLYPDAARLLDRDERLPLHWACHADASTDVIQTLLGPYPSGLMVEEKKYGYTPLHIAVHRGASLGVISALLFCMPRAATITDSNGALPIHVVCKRGIRVELPTLKSLVKAFPEGVKVKDKMDRTPVDLAQACKDKDVRAAMVKMLKYRRSKSLPRYRSESPKGAVPKRGSSGSRSDSSSHGTCVICLEHSATHLLYPCGHVCLCASCANKNLDQLNSVCPIGRCKFRKAVRAPGCRTIELLKAS